MALLPWRTATTRRGGERAGSTALTLRQLVVVAVKTSARRERAFSIGRAAADVVVSTGGMSVGKLDLVKPLLVLIIGNKGTDFRRTGTDNCNNRPTEAERAPQTLTSYRRTTDVCQNGSRGTTMWQVKRLGATILVGRLMMKPGKPAGVARLSRPSTGGGGGGGQSVLVFCLPGNPVSALVCFKLIVVPALRKLAGHRRSVLWSALCASLRRCARDGA
jgi:hypothetical protein